MAKKKLSVIDLQQMKENGEQAVWVTAYDFITAQLAEQAGIDMILVGDSLGMCIYGYDGTIPVTMDQCIYHCEAVRRAAPNTFIIGDMPFGSYQISIEEAVANAIQFHKEANVDARLVLKEADREGELEAHRLVTQARLEGNLHILSLKRKLVEEVLELAFQKAEVEKVALKRTIVLKDGQEEKSFNQERL